MKYHPDDVIESIGNENLVNKRYYNDPFLKKEISSIFKKAEMMGIDITDTESMQGFLSNVFGSIKEFATGVINKGSEAAKTIPTVTVMTQKGTTTVGPGSISYVTNQPIQSVVQSNGGGLVYSQASPSLLNTFKTNPGLLALVAGIPLILVLLSNKKGKSK